MKERPILFNGEMVRAVLDGRKTQTRRLSGLEDVNSYRGLLSGNSPLGPLGYRGLEVSDYNLKPVYKRQFKKTPGIFHWFLGQTYDSREINPIPVKCPYGIPGDLLWVRETWRIVGWHEGEPYLLGYKADGAQLEEPGDSSNYDDDKYSQFAFDCSDDCDKAKIPMDEDGIYHVPDNIELPTRWRPSIHMPRWASRIILKITNVRLERIQEISELDAQREGYYPAPITAREWFIKSWDFIYAKRVYSWDSNPWVWVIEFEIAKGG